jgi:hypothetical protein
VCIHYQDERGVVYVGGRKGTSTKVGTGHLDVRDGHKKALSGGFIREDFSTSKRTEKKRGT